MPEAPPAINSPLCIRWPYGGSTTVISFYKDWLATGWHMVAENLLLSQEKHSQCPALRWASGRGVLYGRSAIADLIAANSVVSYSIN
jgi:hypothetical protein